MSKKAPKSAQYDATVSVPYRKPGLDPSTDLAPANNGKKSNSHSNSHSHGNSNSNKKGQKSTATLAVSSSSHGPTANSSGDNNPFAKVFSLSDSVAEWPVTEPVGQNSAPAEETATKTSSRTKFVPLFSAYGEDLQIKLQGRHPCQCMCTRHSLVNNCIHCGRIVCEQEGSGPCLTCGILVCTLEEAAVLRKGGLDAEKTMNRIYGSEERIHSAKLNESEGKENSLLKAEAHKARLLEFDRTAAQRTKIIDDQADYYNENAFMTAEQRIAIREKEKELRAVRFASRKEKNRKFDLDIAGRAFKSQADEISDMYGDPDIASHLDGTANSAEVLRRLENESGSKHSSSSRKSFEEELATIPDLPRPAISRTTVSRVQDKELQEMSDNGLALSIMQPWASFVVQGLKHHEGRSFYTAHRGKLWIVSGSKMLSANEIVEEENLVKAMMDDDLIVFPEQYVTGSLLGCVDIVDCITQEEYQRRFPGGLLQYPYVFILENPVELERKFPVSGQAKIFSLDHRLHELAKRQPPKKPSKIRHFNNAPATL